MKEKTRVALCLVLALCLALSSTAYALEQTTAETRITYTKTGDNSSPSPPVTAAASYEINIPAEVSLNAGRELYITAANLNLSGGESVVVSVDFARSYTTELGEAEEGGVLEDSYIKLDSVDGSSFAKVNINRHNYDTGAGELIVSTDTTAAVFTGSSLQPSKYGLLYLNLYRPGTIEPGTYSGTLYFTIELVHG